MKKNIQIDLMCLLFVFYFPCKRQGRTEQSKVNASQSNSEIYDSNSTIIIAETIILPNAPARITRKIRQDKHGNQLFAAYTDIIQYTGIFFRKITKDKGLWVGTLNSVFLYDGKSICYFKDE